MVKYCIERWENGVALPNLAVNAYLPYTIEWYQYSKEWPYSEPVHFFEYLRHECIPYECVYPEHIDKDTVYPISISFFDFSVDWFSLMNCTVINALQKGILRLWFFYSEGDNPALIQKHLCKLAEQYNISPAQILFTSSNTSADLLDNFSCFVDDELLFRQRNRHCFPTLFHRAPRKRQYTALSRAHKWWRATTMARLWNQQLHTVGYFSYNNSIDIGDQHEDNPIELDQFKGLRQTVADFLQACPFSADEMNHVDHNDHSRFVEEHFAESYLNLVLETHLDVDQSGGAFLTEKTFKPIKHCQLFIIIGATGSIEKLRTMGYRTFDHIVDHSYDLETNNTRRWDMAMTEAERLIRDDRLHLLYQSCEEDLVHNQNLFLASKADRLNTLLTKLERR
jgi:hypothetical protein